MNKKDIDLEQIKKDVKKVFLELLESAELKPGEGIVLGGSTSRYRYRGCIYWHAFKRRRCSCKK